MSNARGTSTAIRRPSARAQRIAIAVFGLGWSTGVRRSAAALFANF